MKSVRTATATRRAKKLKVYVTPASKITSKSLLARDNIPGAAVLHRLKRIEASIRLIKERVGFVERILEEIYDIEDTAGEA